METLGTRKRCVEEEGGLAGKEGAVWDQVNTTWPEQLHRERSTLGREPYWVWKGLVPGILVQREADMQAGPQNTAAQSQWHATSHPAG